MKDNKEKPAQVIKKTILVKKASSITSQVPPTPATNPVVISKVVNQPTNTTNQAVAKAKVANQPNQPNQPVAKAKVAPPKAISITPVTINRLPADDSLAKASLDICVKITELPTELNTNAQGTKEFFVTANNRQVFIALKAKQYNKLVEAQTKWPNWIGRISGKLGAPTNDGFILEQPSVQAFEKVIKVEITQNQLDSLGSLVYNIGCGNFEKSSVARFINTNHTEPNIEDSFRMWNKGGGKVLKGLVARREAEIALYFKK